jgi:hypothetical protein
MRCKTCDYRLWNLVARRCPECGTPFLPSEFEFVPDSVQFCCPHCETAYYGTGPLGHLVPAEFTCVGCNRLVNMDEMVLRPTDGLEEEQTKVGRAPWLERRERGTIKAWLATVGMALVAPARFMRAVPAASPVGPAWGFAMLTSLATFAVWTIPVGVIGLVVSGVVGAPGAGLGWISCGLFGYALGLCLAAVVFLAVWGLVAHGLLRASGPHSGTLGRTYQALCYSSGANVVTATPCVGMYFGWIWWLVSAIVMLKQAQKVSGVRAVFAAATLPLLSLASLVAAYLWLVFSVVPATTVMAGGTSGMATYETQLVVMAVRQYASLNGGVGPQHAAQLVVDGHLTSANVFSVSSNSMTANAGSVDPTLAGLMTLSSRRQAQAVRAAVAGMPAGVIAHRLGDYVYTYHGINPATATGKLWLVVQSPHPGLNPPPQPTDLVTVGLADGTTIQFPYSTRATQLAAQNALRAQSGLAPLPDPTTLTNPYVPAP